MCIISSPKPQLPPAPTPPEEPVAPMQSPEDLQDTNGSLRKAKSRNGLRIDMNSNTGLNIPT